MDTKEMQGHSECGNCGACGHGHSRHILIKVLIGLFIFWLGVQFGELKSVLRAGYFQHGYGMMGSYGGSGQDYYGGPGMMSGWFSKTASEATTTKK